MKITGFIVLMIISLSCNKSKERAILVKKANDTIKSIDHVYNHFEKRAKFQAKNGVYIYYFGAGTGLSDETAEYVKKEFLNKGIKIDFYYVPCIPLSEKDGEISSYEKAMNVEFEKKYGASIIDSMNRNYELFRREHHQKELGENQ
jgi:hypothetical protein